MALTRIVLDECEQGTVSEELSNVPRRRQKIKRVEEVCYVVIIDESAVEADYQSAEQPSSNGL